VTGIRLCNLCLMRAARGRVHLVQAYGLRGAAVGERRPGGGGGGTFTFSDFLSSP
jgi:hypothetical protein